jgi:hypothetical protein
VSHLGSSRAQDNAARSISTLVPASLGGAATGASRVSWRAAIGACPGPVDSLSGSGQPTRSTAGERHPVTLETRVNYD